MVILLLLPQLLSPSFFLQEGEEKGKKKKKKKDVFDHSYTAGSSLKMGGGGVGGCLLFVDRHDIAYWL